MSNRRITAEIDRMLDNEAYRRARGDHIDDRKTTKTLSRETGLSTGHIANIIAKRRRIHELKIHISGKPPVM